MAKFDMKQYARRGAEARVAELNQELESIYAAFPDLRRGRAQDGAARVTASEGIRRSRRKMTAAQRKAVGERMRKYWAGRRQAKKR